MEELKRWVESERSEFIAIYGRRRVGKTFLVRKALKNQFAFHFSGSYGENRNTQLLNFTLALREQSGNPEIPVPANWTLAFEELKTYISKIDDKKKIIFLDELPWLDTPKSGFIPALEYFWNSWAVWREDIKLIVCGSATSWIINKLIKNKGGLHNRVTHKIQVNPFDLRECEEYFEAYNYGFDRMQIAECYMTMGGIPYYLSLMEKGESVSQNIDRLFFSSDAPLKEEFKELYRALFKNYQNYIKIIEVLAEKGTGLDRQQILDKSSLNNNGEFSKMLEELELCGFIRSYLPYQNNFTRKALTKNSRHTLYQLVDFYTLFYLKFISEGKGKNEKFWSAMVSSSRLNNWRGITFEMLCLCHIPQIKRTLGIGDVSANICAWSGSFLDHKTQIDLLIDRNDFTINLCEMKFSFTEFSIDKDYYEKLQEKINIFRAATGCNKTILLTLISTKGLYKNKYSHIIQREVTLDALFE